jgi:hypothetical protein
MNQKFLIESIRTLKESGGIDNELVNSMSMEALTDIFNNSFRSQDDILGNLSSDTVTELIRVAREYQIRERKALEDKKKNEEYYNTYLSTYLSTMHGRKLDHDKIKEFLASDELQGKMLDMFTSKI